MTEPNINDLSPSSFVENLSLQSQARAQTVEYGRFQAAGTDFVVKCLGYFDVPDDADGQHQKARREGYEYCFRFAAVDADDRVYAVWEIYSASPNNLNGSVSRTVQVDPEWQGQGIGKNLTLIVRSRFSVAWSGLFTASGAKLKDRVEHVENSAQPS